jgi:sugar/nucleoside kinase (ribokinase family)
MNPSGVICAGNIVYDTLVKPVEELRWGLGTTYVESIEYHVGGNGANTARTLGILGVPVRLLGAVGADDQGRFVIAMLERAGVDTRRVVEVSTPTAATVVVVNSTGNRKFFHRRGASDAAFAVPIDFNRDLCNDMSHFHLASFFVMKGLRARGAEPLICARAAGLTTSLDTNWDPQGLWLKGIECCLPHLDILFMNEDEAAMVTGSRDPATGANLVLSKGVNTAVMKLSSRGCAIYTSDHEILCSAFKVPAKDTTGAGDCFAGGFLAALQRGASLAEAGQFANAVAALSVQAIGAVEGVLPFEETNAWMRTAALNI